IVLLNQHMPGQPQQRFRIRERADDIRAPLDLFVESFEWVRGPDLLPMLWRELGKREQVILGRIKKLSRSRMTSGEHRHHLTELSMHELSFPARHENCSDNRGD